MELLDTIFPVIAWTVVLLLFGLQNLFGIALTFSLFGHLSQYISKKSSSRVDRTQT
ncbi:MAG: hypothetical protein GY859_07415 [Desulfobacterales bacterium]|nr:hypothetical protein [Desulfobacterales bacterium]